jgi:hypothetical protein
MRIRSVWEPVLKMIASEAPAPLVLCNVSVDEAEVPPLISGTVSEVQVGVADVPIVTPNTKRKWCKPQQHYQ